MTVKSLLHYCLVLLIFLGSSYSVFHNTRHIQSGPEHFPSANKYNFELSPDEHTFHSENKQLQQICDTCLVLLGFKVTIYNDPVSINLLRQATAFADSSHLFVFENKAYYHSRAPPFTA